MARYNPTERSGVNKVASIITDEISWIFREQFISDVGIDAIIEQTIDNNPTGKLIAFQIKSGESYLKNQDETHIYFRLNSIHYNYWIELCIPVLIVLYDPSSSKAYWALFSDKELKVTGNSYILSIKKTNVLGNSSINDLNDIIDYHLKSTLLDDVGDIELDYEHLIEMCTLYTEEATDLIDEINKYGYSLADKIFTLINSIHQQSKFSPNMYVIFNKIKVNYNIYSTKLKKNLPIFFKLRVNSLKYAELCISHYDNQDLLFIRPFIIDFYQALCESINIIIKMISDIKLGIEVHKSDPNKYPSDVQKSIKNKVLAEEEYIFMLQNINKFTHNVISSLPEVIKKELTI